MAQLYLSLPVAYRPASRHNSVAAPEAAFNLFSMINDVADFS